MRRDLLGEWQAEFELPETESPVHGKVTFRRCQRVDFGLAAEYTLCLHRFESFRAAAAGAGDVRLFGESAVQVFLPIIEDWAARTDTGDRAEIGELPEELPFWREDRRNIRELHRQRVPSPRRLLRHEDAPARGRVGSDRGEPPSAVRRRVGPSERLRRGHSRARPRHRRRSASARGCGHPVPRRRRQQLPLRGSRPGRRSPHHVGRRGGSGKELRHALDRVAERAERFFAALVRDMPTRSPSGDNRVRFTSAAIEPFTRRARCSRAPSRTWRPTPP